MAGKAWYQEQEAADHIAATGRKQREQKAAAQGLFLLFTQPRTPAYEMSYPQLKPASTNLVEITSH